MVQEELDRLDVQYVTHVRVGDWHPDIFVDPDLVIEVDGDYWHSDKFPKTVEKDARSTQWWKDNGLRVLRLKEHELHSRATEAILREGDQVAMVKAWKARLEIAVAPCLRAQRDAEGEERT